MTYIIRQRLVVILILSSILVSNQVFAQWKGTYGNEWMIPGQPYLKVLVEKLGMHRISISALPSDFSTNDLSKLQLWHRGKQVAISVSQTEIIFFGEPNDGASDSLVYRPETARLNPYISLYSNKSAYFLTLGSTGRRIQTKNHESLSKLPISYHLQEDVVTYTNQFAFTTFDIKAALNKSYYEAANTWTGPSLAGVKTRRGSVKDSVLIKPFVLKNYRSDINIKPLLEVLFAGLNVGNHNIQIYVGKSSTDTDMRKVGSINFTGMDARKSSYILNSDDIKSDGSGFIKVRSTSADTTGDWYSLSYYKLSYPQKLDMADKKSSIFNIPATDDTQSQISVSGSTEGLLIYDITNRSEPVKLESKLNQGVSELSVDRLKGKNLTLFSFYPSELIDLRDSSFSRVNFKAIFPTTTQTSPSFVKPSDFDYLIVTNKNLSSGAVKYAEYRTSVPGGSHKVLVMDINDIYDQFNYGEPTPIGLRRYVNWMLKEGVRDGHSLFLIGNSVSYPAFLVKELPNDIPTFGDPGADILLVAGLAGYDQNVPAIPIGRLNAFNSDEVGSYLEKVKKYESESDVAWRKNILHLNGGHSVSEINQLKGILADIAPIVEKGEVGGQVKAFVKSNPSATSEKVDIKDDVNAGVGMITFFGHGSQQLTDLDMGFVSNVSWGYEGSKKYSAMFFNGCGVGNIFTSRTKHVLSSDWIVTENKGSVVVIANAYDSYVSSSSSYLRHLYSKLFGEKEIYTVGEALKEVAIEIVKEGASEYEIANFQQSNLQGDPAIKLIRVSKPDFSVSDRDIALYSDNKSVTLEDSQNPQLAIVLSNFGRFDAEQKPLIKIRYTKKDGTSQTIDQVGMSVAYSDTLWVPVVNLKDITSISIKLDPQNIISELNESNNEAHLEIDWEIAKSKYVYSNELLVDEIAPQLSVRINQRRIMNEEIISPQPEIQISVRDDRTMELNHELVNVYIKPCYDDACEFVKIPDELLELKLTEGNEKELTILYKGESLLEGKYELLVSAKDESGNVAANSYQVKFEIGESSQVLSLICFPNPASEYVKFELRPSSTKPIQQIKWVVYSSSGHQIDEGEVKSTSAEVINWYWTPTVANGIYIYKAIISSDIGISEITGKISLIR